MWLQKAWIMLTVMSSSILVLGQQQQQQQQQQDRHRRPAVSAPLYCEVLLSNLSTAVAEFEKCAVSEARPVLLCLVCRDAYVSVMQAHEDMTKKHNSVGREGNSCAENYSEKDELNIFPTMVDKVLGKMSLWSKAQCEACYENDGTLKNTTQEVMQHYYETMDCFESDANETKCTLCLPQFNQTMEYYRSHILADADGMRMSKVCMDLRDMINVTTIIWSEQLHCHSNWFLPWYHLLVPFSILVLYMIFMMHYAIKGFLLGYEEPHSYNLRILPRFGTTTEMTHIHRE